MQPAYNDLRGSAWRGLPAYFSDSISSFSLSSLTLLRPCWPFLPLNVFKSFASLGSLHLLCSLFLECSSPKWFLFPIIFFFLNQIFRDAFPDCYTWNIFPSVTQSFTALLTLCLSLQRAECWCSSVASLIVYLPCQNVIFTWTGAFSCSWLLLLQLKQPSAHSRNSINACLKKYSMNLILRAHFFKVRPQTISISLY